MLFDLSFRLARVSFVAVAALYAPLGRAESQPCPATAPLTFDLPDQFGHQWRSDSLQGRALVLVAGARSQNALMMAWSDSLQRALALDTSAVRWLMVADLRSVPRFMHRLASQRAPREAHRVLLLDTDGSIAQRLGLDRRALSVVVLDASRQVRLRLMDVAPTTDQVRLVRGTALGR